ncbi:Uncharacterised protein [Turicibacter sanguinis]|nr:Uncharacterised protein [Turicibacter sanguinis]
MKLGKSTIIGGLVATTVVAGTITFNTELVEAVKSNIEALKDKVVSFAENDKALVEKYGKLKLDAETKISELTEELANSGNDNDKLESEIIRLQGEVNKANVAISELDAYSTSAVEDVSKLEPTPASKLPGLGDTVEEEKIATGTAHFYQDSVNVTVTLNDDINIALSSRGNVQIEYLNANGKQVKLKGKSWAGYLNCDGQKFGNGWGNNKDQDGNPVTYSNELVAGNTYSTTLKTQTLKDVAKVIITVTDNYGNKEIITIENPNR